MHPPFLTDIDPRAAVRGSRDPLGVVPLWAHFGRQVVGNLTTVTDSVRGFSTLLLGHFFARQVQETSTGEAESTLALFLKFEQLAAYARYGAAKDGKFRGIDRVKRNLAQGGAVTLSAKAEHQILSDQKTYGLWGLYSTAARASGLLHRTEVGLALTAREFIEGQYLASLTKAGHRDGRAIVDLLRSKEARFDVLGKHAAVAKALAKILGQAYSNAERAFYREHLLHGGPDGASSAIQRLAAELMERLPEREPFDRKALRALTKEAGKREGLGQRLAGHLQGIDRLESVLVPAASAFGFMQARHGQKVASVAREIEKTWGPLSFIDVEAIQELRPEIQAAVDVEGGGCRWVAIARGLTRGDIASVLGLLMEQNAIVMRARHGSQPWLRLERGTLDVRFRDEASGIPGRRELPGMWANNYFLNPLKAVVDELREG